MDDGPDVLEIMKDEFPDLAVSAAQDFHTALRLIKEALSAPASREYLEKPLNPGFP